MITEVEFSKSIEQLLPSPHGLHIAVAVSGGADSLCLSLLLQQWALTHNARIVALTVDHLLRPESSSEALKVHGWLSARGLEHHILRWEKDRTPSSIQDSARKARYELLTQWCEQNNFRYLAVAHNLEDQFETILQRLAHHSGPIGLAGISSKREYSNITILRPLLNTKKKVITQTLESMQQPWIEDPSNQNHNFTRVKIRHQQDLWDQFGLTREKVISFQTKMSLKRTQMEEKMGAFFTEHVILYPEGYCEVNLKFLKALEYDVLQLVITRLLKLMSGKIYPPRQESMTRILSHLESGTKNNFHGCLLESKQGKLLICREANNMAGPITFSNSKTVFWDNRFKCTLTSPDEPQDLTVRALGDSWIKFTNNAKLMSLPPAVRPTLPSIWQKERLLNIPHLDYYDNLKVLFEFERLFSPI